MGTRTITVGTRLEIMVNEKLELSSSGCALCVGRHGNEHSKSGQQSFQSFQAEMFSISVEL